MSKPSYDDLQMCNCAGCGKELLSRKHTGLKKLLAAKVDLPPVVYGHINGRPFCDICLNSSGPKTRKRSGKFPDGDEDDPSFDNVVKASEE